ncbi:peptide deformylase [Candidatus Woesebacteria bacterium]|nr:peptide deformylase [Candidatus Woesebacteria bacterium]
MASQRPGLVAPNDPVLIKIAEEIPPEKIPTPETQEIIEKLLNIAHGEQADRTKPVMVGLAAPQAGISKRIILVDVGADGHGVVSDLRVYLNPEIAWSSEEKEEWYEGCYSTDSVCGIVERPRKVKVAAYDRKGERIEEEYEGYVARIFQHEIDHLNGKEFVTHITNDDNLHWVEDNEFPQYRDIEAWRNWPNKCPRERWEKIKGEVK